MGYKPKTCGSLGGDQSHNFHDYNTPILVHFDTSNVELTADVDHIYVQIEPNEILNHDWIIQNHSKFKRVFCWESNLLTLPNAILHPFGSCWVDTNKAYSKEFGVSHLCSSKNQLMGHGLRHQIFESMNRFHHKKINLRTPPRIPSKEVLFDGFQYSVIVENISKNNWFTEKLIDCLVTKTIPIYYGCPNINEFFDDSYFLKFNNINEFQNILQSLDSLNYDRVIGKIEYNRMKALEWINIWTRLNKELDKLYV